MPAVPPVAALLDPAAPPEADALAELPVVPPLFDPAIPPALDPPAPVPPLLEAPEALFPEPPLPPPETVFPPVPAAPVFPPVATLVPPAPESDGRLPPELCPAPADPLRPALVDSPLELATLLPFEELPPTLGLPPLDHEDRLSSVELPALFEPFPCATPLPLHAAENNRRAPNSHCKGIQCSRGVVEFILLLRMQQVVSARSLPAATRGLKGSCEKRHRLQGPALQRLRFSIRCRRYRFVDGCGLPTTAANYDTALHLKDAWLGPNGSRLDCAERPLPRAQACQTARSARRQHRGRR